MHQDFYTVVMQEGVTYPKPPQRFSKCNFLQWAEKLVRAGAEVHAVYEACGFGFCLQSSSEDLTPADLLHRINGTLKKIEAPAVG